MLSLPLSKANHDAKQHEGNQCCLIPVELLMLAYVQILLTANWVDFARQHVRSTRHLQAKFLLCNFIYINIFM